MNIRHAWAIAVSCITLIRSPVLAAEEEAPWKVCADLAVFAVAEKRALELIPQLQREDRVEVVFAQLEKEFAAGTAELAAAPLLTVLGNTSGVIEAGEQMPYPTEFDPPKLPRELPAENVADALKAWPAVSITPTSFEKRLVGVTFEFASEKVAPNAAWVDVTVKVLHTRLLRMMRFEAGILPGGKTIGVEQPVFHSVTSFASTRLRNGQRALIGVHKLRDNRWEFHVVRARIEKP